MAMMQRALMCLIALVAILAAAGPAAAIRLSCEELAAQREAGRSNEDIMRSYGTTRARLAACDRLTEQEERFANERQRFHFVREQRGLAH